MRVTLAGVTKERAGLLLGEVVPGAETNAQGDRVIVGFTREVGDDVLDRALRTLVGGGARVVSVEAERATLLDVIESFEREEGEGGGG